MYPSYILVSILQYSYSYNYILENLLRAFRYCCLVCISPSFFNSSIRLLASVRVSVCPDKFFPSNTSILV